MDDVAADEEYVSRCQLSNSGSGIRRKYLLTAVLVDYTIHHGSILVRHLAILRSSRHRNWAVDQLLLVIPGRLVARSVGSEKDTVGLPIWATGRLAHI